MFRADLHAHTTCSDGSLSPEELVFLAKEVGLSALCITDHDTVAAYPRAIDAARSVGLLLGTGVEFSAVYHTMNVHILGYDIAIDHPHLVMFCARHKQRRCIRNRAILEKLAQHQIFITEQELESKGTLLGRPHIAQLMVEKGGVPTIQHAFSQYIGDGKCCYVDGGNFTVEETIEVIHEAGGKAFLAHPHLLDHKNKIIRLLQCPFDGIECYYAKFSLKEEKKWIKIAKDLGLMLSGGSDFHGTMKAYIPLGCSWVDEAIFYSIFQKPIA